MFSDRDKFVARPAAFRHPCSLLAVRRRRTLERSPAVSSGFRPIPSGHPCDPHRRQPGIEIAMFRDIMTAFDPTSKQEILNRVRAEFLEMPGLRLRLEQAQRFWGLDRRTCEELLTSLVDAKFLARRPNDVYCLS